MRTFFEWWIVRIDGNMQVAVASQALPKDDLAKIVGRGGHPSMRRVRLDLGAQAHVGVEAEAEQNVAQQDCVILAVALVARQKRVQVEPLFKVLFEATHGRVRLHIAN